MAIQKQKSFRKLVVILALLMIPLSVSAFWLVSTVAEKGPMGLLPFQGGGAQGVVRLKTQPVYRIKRKQDVLGMQVVRIVSRQQPEEFLVLDGVSRDLVDSVYGKGADLGWANLMAAQFLKMRQGGEEAGPLSIEVQEIRSIQSGTIERDGQTLPYWQLQVRFKLGNEPESRVYEAGVVRNVRGPEGSQDTLVVSYAQKEAFDPKLLNNVLALLSFPDAS